eukprot:scaffold1202_cov61-Phaeocystis_antarctica.AAC.2
MEGQQYLAQAVLRRPLAHRRPVRRVARIHRRGALGSATTRRGAFCSSSMAHACMPPPLSHAGFRTPPGTWNLEPGRNMYASFNTPHVTT